MYCIEGLKGCMQANWIIFTSLKSPDNFIWFLCVVIYVNYVRTISFHDNHMGIFFSCAFCFLLSVLSFRLKEKKHRIRCQYPLCKQLQESLHADGEHNNIEVTDDGSLTLPSVSSWPATSLSSFISSSSNLPCVTTMGEADFTTCENMFDGGWHGTKGTPWIFTKPLMNINGCWTDVVCSTDEHWWTWMPHFNGPHILLADLTLLHTFPTIYCPSLPKMTALAHLAASSWWCTTIFHHCGSWALSHTEQLVVSPRPTLLCWTCSCPTSRKCCFSPLNLGRDASGLNVS